MKHDIHSSSGENDDSSALPLRGKDFWKTLRGAASSSAIVPDGRNLLLLRIGQQAPIFSVSPGGEVRAVVAEVPREYVLSNLTAGAGTWTAIYQRSLPNNTPNSTAELELAAYALDPATGKIMGRYAYAQPLWFGLACGDGKQFTAFMHEGNDLQVVTLRPSGK